MARRLGIDSPKELLLHDGRPVIDWSVAHLAAAEVDRIVVVIREGKEAIAEHLIKTFPAVHFEFVLQDGDIGNLLDALKVAAPRVRDARVLFCFPDTRIQPNPFVAGVDDSDAELFVHCFSTETEWANFGVIDEGAHHIVDKPDHFVGTTCWGALEWTPRFTAKLAHATDLTALMNAAGFAWHTSLTDYVDIGIDRKTAGLDKADAA